MKRVENGSKISEKEYKLVYPKVFRSGILCGSPKAHKPVINNHPKSCPILSAIRTSIYKLANF